MTDIINRAKAALEGIAEGSWRYRPQKYDDWGVVRGGKMEGDPSWLGYICQAKDQRVTEEQENEARRNGTDPWEANACFIADAPDLIRDLVAEVERLRGVLELFANDANWFAAINNGEEE